VSSWNEGRSQALWHGMVAGPVLICGLCPTPDRPPWQWLNMVLIWHLHAHVLSLADRLHSCRGLSQYGIVQCLHCILGCCLQCLASCIVLHCPALSCSVLHCPAAAKSVVLGGEVLVSFHASHATLACAAHMMSVCAALTCRVEPSSVVLCGRLVYCHGVLYIAAALLSIRHNTVQTSA
jgi:hypothetical protein